MKGWLYIAVVKDCHSCEIVGSAMNGRMTRTLMRCVRHISVRNQVLIYCIIRTAAASTAQKLTSHYKQSKLQTSISRKVDCWNNAPMESFFGTLKTICLHHYKLITRDEAKRKMFEYIDVFYNRIRRHENTEKKMQHNNQTCPAKNRVYLRRQTTIN